MKNLQVTSSVVKGRILFFLWDCERDKGFCSDFSYSTFGKPKQYIRWENEKKKRHSDWKELMLPDLKIYFETES